MIPPFKISVTPEQSRRIQELIFQLGGMWGDGNRHIQYLDKSYLYYNSTLMQGSDLYGFVNDDLLEYPYDSLISRLERLQPDSEVQEVPVNHLEETQEEPQIDHLQAVTIPNFKMRVTPEQCGMIQRLLAETYPQPILQTGCCIFYRNGMIWSSYSETDFREAQLPLRNYDEIIPFFAGRSRPEEVREDVAQRLEENRRNILLELNDAREQVIPLEDSSDFKQTDKIIDDLKRWLHE